MRRTSPPALIASLLSVLVLCGAVASANAGERPAAATTTQATPSSSSPAVPNDLDAFMSRVLQRRDETWRKLHDYILSETETFGIEGPGKIPLNGFKREYTWYVREGFLVRSPLRYDGVATPEADRRKYEDDWLKREKAREERARAKAAKAASGSEKAGAGQESPRDTTANATAPGKNDVPSLEQFVDQRGEPRFISEAYFLQFKFEPGNYYLAGRERIAGRDVLKVEYYPTGLFGADQRERAEESRQDTQGKDKPKPRKPDPKEEQKEQEIERKLNKVALVTLWVDPAEYQIVKYTFDNTEFDFLPGRWLVRVGDVTASMTMSRVLDGVWLPGEIEMHADLVFASGHYGFKYARSFYDYKKAEVGARVRIPGGDGR